MRLLGGVHLAHRGTAQVGDGGRREQPHAHLPEGPTRVFNLMLREDAAGELLVRPLNGAMLPPQAPRRRWFVYLLGGSAGVRLGTEDRAMRTGEGLWIEPAAAQARIEGGGELVLVRLDG